MSKNQLDNLQVTNGTLTLTASSLPGAPLGELLDIYNSGQPLIIRNAKKTVTPNSVAVSGSARFMNVPALDVDAMFTLGAGGTLTATLRFTLIGETPGPNPWRFSQSFPALPSFTKDPTASPFNFLDTLALSNAAFILTTVKAGREKTTGAPFSFGLNFVGQLRPTGLTALLDSLVGGKKSVLLYGPINMPLLKQRVPPLPPMKYPWQVSPTVPGIHLQADLGLDFKLANSNLRFHETNLRIYCPTNISWLEANRTYLPTRAVSGRLEVPSANISADLTAKLIDNFQGMTLSGAFEGMSLENLGKLKDLAGGGDLFNFLPDEMKKSGQALGGLSLEALGLSFVNSPTPSAVYITVGIPKANVHVLPDFIVKSIRADFAISQPFSSTRSVAVTLDGVMEVAGAPFDISIQLPDIIGRATLQESATIPLSRLFKQLALPPPTDLTVETMELMVTPRQGFFFNAVMADNPPWQLDLGPVPMSISDVQLAFSKDSSGKTQAAFAGMVEFGDDLSLAMNYELPGDFMLRADLPEVKLSKLISRLNETGLDLTPGFDFALGQSHVLITKRGDNLSFSAATVVESVGLLVFTAQKQARWGFAVGLDLGSAGLSAIPGLGALSAFESFIGLEKIILVVSSIDEAGFQFPDMAKFDAPRLGNKNLRLPSQASGLVRGMNIYAGLSTSKSQGFRALAKFLHLKLDGSVGLTLAVSLPQPSTNSKLFISVSEEIQSGIMLTGMLGLLMQAREVAVFLAAEVKMQVQGQPLQFDVTALVLPNGVLVTGTMRGTVSFGPVSLSNLALVIGLNFEGIPSLGVAATLDVGDFNSSVALFFDSTQPSKSMISGAMSDLTLLDVVKSIAGQSNVPGGMNVVLGMFGLKGLNAFSMPASLAAALDNRDLGALSSAFRKYGQVALPATSDSILLVVNTKGSVWHVTDMSTMLHYNLTRQDAKINVALEAQLYFAPQETFIGSMHFPEGFHVTAEIDYLLLKAKLKILINPRQGIAADVDVSPIIILSQSFFALTGADGKGGPRLSLATYKQPNLADAQLRDPHFMLTGNLRVLGVDISDTYVSINEHGMEFKLGEQVSPAMRIDLQGKLDGAPNLNAGGDLVVGINRGLDLDLLGHINVKINVRGSLKIVYQGGSARASFQGSFSFQAILCNIPKISLDVSGPALQNIAETLWGYVKDIISKLLLDPNRWLSWLQENIISGVGQAAEEVGRVLSNVYRLSSNEVAAKTRQALSYGVEQTAQALKGAGVAAEQAVSALQTAGFQTAEIAAAIPNVFTQSHVDTSFGHIDTPAGPHADTPSAPHVDTPGAPHVDESGKHVDFGAHFDEGKSVFHADEGRHTDMRVSPHIDTQGFPHVDTAGFPHVDTQTPPHGDTGTHIDT